MLPASFMATAARLAMVGVFSISLLRPTIVSAQAGGRSVGDTLTLTLDVVLQRARQDNPELRAARYEIAVAQGAVRQAGTYVFNPQLSSQTSSSLDGSFPYEMTVMQEIELGGQWGLRRNAAQRGLERTAFVVQDAGRLTLAEAGLSFVQALAASRRLRVTRDAVALTERLLDAVRTQLREGEISQLEANLAEIEAGRARGRVMAAQREYSSAEQTLKLRIGVAPEVPITLVDERADPDLSDATQSVAPPPRRVFATDSLLAVAQQQRPDLAAGSASVQEYEARVALTRREGLPNLRLGVLVERSDGAARVGPAIGFSIPLFNRNQGLADAQRALATQARLARDATNMRIRTEVTNALLRYRSATAEAEAYATSVLQPAHANAALLDTAYRAGKIDLPTLLLLRNQLLDAELGFWDTWLAQAEASVLLDAATGAHTPSPDTFSELPL